MRVLFLGPAEKRSLRNTVPDLLCRFVCYVVIIINHNKKLTDPIEVIRFRLLCVWDRFVNS